MPRTTISFSGDDSEKGIGLSYTKLATLRSNTMTAMVVDGRRGQVTNRVAG